MPITLITKSKQTILIEDTPFASGGEGDVHKITSPSHVGYCVKLYFKPYRTQQREQKVDFMAKSPPPNLAGLQAGGCVICWPKEAVYQGNQFMGFIMPLAFSGSIELYELCTPKLKSKVSPIWHSKYDRSLGTGVEARLKLCVNIASAVHTIHSMGKYVLVDLKPQNILVTDDGRVSMIDMDSVQIMNGNAVLFSAQVATPEYIPVEGNHINPAKDLVPETWDRFSLAVVFYELLFGLHPYAASYKGRYQNSSTVADSIKNGLFVFGSRSNYVYTKPPLHDNFGMIPTPLQSLFSRAFDSGHSNPDIRPKAEEWGKVIYVEITKSTQQLRNFSNAIKQQAKVNPQVATKPLPTTPANPATVPQPVAPTRPLNLANPSFAQKLPAWAIVTAIISIFLLILIIIALASTRGSNVNVQPHPTQADNKVPVTPSQTSPPKIKRPQASTNGYGNVIVKNYNGTIDYKYGLEMTLRRAGSNLSGSYFYSKYRRSCTLSGNIDSDQRIILRGYHDGTAIDVFEGHFLSNGSIQGNWHKPGEEYKKLPFEFRPIN